MPGGEPRCGARWTRRTIASSIAARNRLATLDAAHCTAAPPRVARRGLRERAAPACSSRRRCAKLGAHGFPGDIVVGACQRLTRTPLDFARPGGFYIHLRLAIEAGEQLRGKLRAFRDGKLHRVNEQLSGTVGHQAIVPARCATGLQPEPVPRRWHEAADLDRQRDRAAVLRRQRGRGETGGRATTRRRARARHPRRCHSRRRPTTRAGRATAASFAAAAYTRSPVRRDS